MAKVEKNMTNPFSMSNEDIKQKINETHAHTETTFDVDSLFIVVENILTHSTQIAEEVVQGRQAHSEIIEEKSPKPDFSVPMCMLKQIVCQISCKASGEETHETTMSILKELSNFPWVAKAVLTLAAFAMEFGDFFHQSVHHRLVKSLGTPKRVRVVLTKQSELQKRRQAIVNLNYLIKSTLEVTQTMFEWEKLSCYDPKRVPVLSITVVAYWIIMTIVTCATNATILTSDEDKRFDVSVYNNYTNKLNQIISTLKGELHAYKMKREKEDHYSKVVKALKDPTDVVAVLKILFSTADFTPQLIDAPNKLGMDVPRKKHVLVLISGLQISNSEIEILDSFDREMKKENKGDQYKIVWVPIVLEKWTDEFTKSFETLRSQMSWSYAIKLEVVTPGVRFIKKEWDFNGQPMVVVMNPQGEVENHNALPSIRVWGTKAFPFGRKNETKMSIESNWFGSVMNKIQAAQALIADEKNYIFFYGGKTKQKWPEDFEEKLKEIENAEVIKNKQTSIKWRDLGKEAKKFWEEVQSMFLVKLNQEDQEAHPDQITQEIQKLFSNKYHTEGWAVLAKGSVMKVAGAGQKFLEVLKRFDEWKQKVEEKDFEAAFEEFYSNTVMESQHCCRLDIPILARRAPERMKCAECDLTMKRFITYKCCVNDE